MIRIGSVRFSLSYFRFALFALGFLWLAACNTWVSYPPIVGDLAKINRVLDTLHLAASEADEERYFALFAPNSVFIGTDATERWPISVFREYAHARFSTGQGWTYTVTERHIDFSYDADVAWFDELLDNENYGVCRGTGVLERDKLDGQWRIVQYHLTIPVPNDLAMDVARQIREMNQ